MPRLIALSGGIKNKANAHLPEGEGKGSGCLVSCGVWGMVNRELGVEGAANPTHYSAFHASQTLFLAQLIWEAKAPLPSPL